LISGCALSRLHSQPLIDFWLRASLMFRAIALTLRARLHWLWLRPSGLALRPQPLSDFWLRAVALAFAAAQ
jgi:hypothetical protein